MLMGEYLHTIDAKARVFVPAKLRDELGYAPRSLYRLRDGALKKFTLAMYGVELL